MVRRLVEAARADLRVVGVVDYGSASFGRVDEWSDIDAALFLRDDAYDDFWRGWKEWAARLGPLLLAYVGIMGHPWTVYEGEPVPVRIDLDLHRESTLDNLLNWANSPVSVQAMVLHDATGGRLTGLVRQMIGKSLAPADLAATFERECGDFWYFWLYVFSKLQRGEAWVARQVFHLAVMEHLFRLLRFEAGAFDRWRESPGAFEVERTLAPGRLARLDACVPAPGAEGVRRALAAAASLGRDVCASIAAQYGWPWPERLGEGVMELAERG